MISITPTFLSMDISLNIDHIVVEFRTKIENLIVLFVFSY